jgi:predicted TIM-barrel fold metal-dependent hydrolase
MRKPAKKREKGHAKRTAARRATTADRPKGPRAKPVVIDVHAHILVPEVMKVTFGHSQYAHRVAGPGGSGPAPSMAEPLMRRMTEAPLRLKAMDETGVDIQVISPSIMQQCTYGLEPQQAIELERAGNDAVAEVVAQHPDRLVGLGSLPLQDVALSTAELERCRRELDLRGVIISSHVNGVELGDERLLPFWAKAEELGAVIFIHPAGAADERMRRNRLMITIGQPLEEAFALSSLIYEGIADHFPKLKIMVAHGGGVSALLRRPTRQRLPQRPLAPAQKRVQQLSAAILLRHGPVQPGHAGVFGDKGTREPCNAGFGLSIRGKTAGGIRPPREEDFQARSGCHPRRQCRVAVRHRDLTRSKR